MQIQRYFLVKFEFVSVLMILLIDLLTSELKFKDDYERYPRNFFPPEMYNASIYSIENPVIVYNRRPVKIVLQCVPNGVRTPNNTQGYVWRYLNGRAIIRSDRYSLDILRGELTIVNPSTSLDNTYRCDCVTADDSVVSFYHNVFTAVDSVVRRVYNVIGYTMGRCQIKYIEAEKVAIIAMTNKALCGDEAGLQCDFETTPVISKRTVKLNMTNSRTNYAEALWVESCVLGFHTTHSLPHGYQKNEDCESINCYLKDVTKALEEHKAAVFQGLFRAYRDRFDSMVWESSADGTISSTFYPVNWTSRLVPNCAVGYLPVGVALCLPCPPGTRGKESSQDTENFCEKCPDGYFNDKFHNRNCSHCPRGLAVNRESTKCSRVTRLYGERDVDMKQLLKNSDEVTFDLGFDPKDPWYHNYWKKVRAWRFWVAAILGSCVALVILIGIFVWKCNQPFDEKKNARKMKSYSMKNLMFRAAADVYRKDQIIKSMSPEERMKFDKKTPEEQSSYLDAIIQREKLKRKLYNIRNRPIGPPLGDPRVNEELSIGTGIGGVSGGGKKPGGKGKGVKKGGLKKPAKNDRSASPKSQGFSSLFGNKFRKSPRSSSLPNKRPGTPTGSGKMKGTPPKRNRASPSPPGKSPRSSSVPGKRPGTPTGLRRTKGKAPNQKEKSPSPTGLPVFGNIFKGLKDKVTPGTKKPVPKVVIKDSGKNPAQVIPKIPKPPKK